MSIDDQNALAGPGEAQHLPRDILDEVRIWRRF